MEKVEKKDALVYNLNIVQTVLNSKVMNLPQEMFVVTAPEKNFKVIFDFGDAQYPVTVGGKPRDKKEEDELTYYKGYRVSLTVELKERLMVEFPYSYMLNVAKQLSRSAVCEFLTIRVMKVNGDYIFKVIDKKVYEHEVWSKILPSVEKYIIAGQFEEHKSKDESQSHKVYLQKFYHNIPFSEREEYRHVRNALYMWIDKNRKKIYIGFSTNFVERLRQHSEKTSKSDECENYYGSKIEITHFSFWHVRNKIAVGLIKAFESSIIAMVAAILPNRSNKIKPLLDDTAWQLVNNNYND